ncbi:glycosyltransferase [Dactylosporangium sp. CS-047395]|uniref:glycosyltransferase n=1 Tax=Dactylosporangium sp. CS-047395 TaxID=3239936 RepID=UPI003D8C8CC4
MCAAVVLDVAIPVYNEERDLEPCIRRLHAYLSANLPYTFRITIADNGSTDATPGIAKELVAEFPEVSMVRIEAAGKGLALRTAWSGSDAAVLAYMDVDLSTDLAALLPLIAPLITGHSDIAIGTRLARGSRVVRGPKREAISRAYNLLLRGTLAMRISDAQCGFKAIRHDIARGLLPYVQDTGWFFDTELLILAQRANLRIHEVPVDWIDDDDSRVDVVSAALADVRGIWRLGRALVTRRLPLALLRHDLGRSPLLPGVPAGLGGQLVRFIGIGIASTVFFAVLYALLRIEFAAQTANFTALLVSAIANTLVNRRVTFGVRGPGKLLRHLAQGLLLFGLGLALTSGSLVLLHAVHPPAAPLELAVLVVSSFAATALRFLLLRFWLGRPGRTAAGSKERAYELHN